MKENFLKFLEGKEITEEQFKEKTAQDMADLYNEYMEVYSKELEGLVESKASKEDIETMKSELMEARVEQMKNINESLKQQGLAIKKLSTKEKEERSNQTTVSKGLADNLDKLKALAGKDDINNVRAGEFGFKVAGDMSLTGNTSGGNIPVEQRLLGFNIVPSRNITLMDLVTRGVAVSNIISWVYQANKDGAAGGTAEAATKNQIDFDLVVDSETVKKRTAYIKVSDEMIEDVGFMESEINNELMRELAKDIESQVYEGDGTGTNLNGIRTVSTAFAAGTFVSTVDNANIVDVLRVAFNQIAIAEHDEATAVLMHPSDLTSLLLEKVSTTDKRYIRALEEIASNRTIDGIPIVTTTLVTQDEYLVGRFPLATVWDKGAIDVQVGLDGNDFTKNQRTIRAEWRGLVAVRNNNRTAFIAGDFTTDKLALNV